MRLHLLLLSLVSWILSFPAPAGCQDVAPRAQDPVLDSVRLDLAQGRSWHAARRLRAAYGEGRSSRPEVVLLMAEADSGWENWEGVLRLIELPLREGQMEGPEFWYLLGRAYDGLQMWAGADSAYGRALQAGEAPRPELITEAQARRALVRGRLARFREALEDLEQLKTTGPVLADWVAMDLAARAADQGDREVTRLALSSVGREEVRRLGWDLPPRALLAAGDSVGAEAAFWSALPSLENPPDRVAAWDRIALLRLARGDSLGALGAFHQVLALSSSGAAVLRASEGVLDLGTDSTSVALTAALAFAGAGRHAEALEAYDLVASLSPESLPPGVLLARARSLSGAGRTDEALDLSRELAASEDSEVGAPALALQAQLLRRSGSVGDARVAEDELLSRFPTRTEGAEILFSRAEALDSQGDREGAIRGYLRTAEQIPAHDLAGQSRMRMGQLLLAAGREAEALRVYSDYLLDFPQGRRWDEAAFWAGRLLGASGRDAESRELLNRLRETYPLSYYAVRASDLLGEPFAPPIAVGGDPPPLSPFLQEGLARFDELLGAGLPRGASWEVEAMAARIRTDMDPERRFRAMVRLANELNARGFTREGINLGWDLRREGRGWDRELLAAVYPFPYRAIVLAEAEGRRADPFLIAGLIRQESAFWVEARSRADARGLMQVLPTTGRGLARSLGLSGFDPERHLYKAEINVHLGVAFFADMRRRFGEELPIILSAYNAGPSRAERWRQYPEAKDMDRFVERIPFTETRGYVKNVTANRAIYRWLYGGESGESTGRGSDAGFFP